MAWEIHRSHGDNNMEREHKPRFLFIDYNKNVSSIWMHGKHLFKWFQPWMIFQPWMVFIKGMYYAWLLAISIIMTFNLHNNLVKWGLITPSKDEKPTFRNLFFTLQFPTWYITTQIVTWSCALNVVSSFLLLMGITNYTLNSST